MTTGEKDVFAIESEITEAYRKPGQRALGFFVVFINGRLYGVRKPDATLLACSRDEVERRLSEAGSHTCPFWKMSAEQISDAVYRSIYGSFGVEEDFCGLSAGELSKLVYEKQLLWAPDGDEAFDDGSYILQIDNGSQVRLIGFKSPIGEQRSVHSVTEVVIHNFEFYGILDNWIKSFDAARQRLLDRF